MKTTTILALLMLIIPLATAAQIDEPKLSAELKPFVEKNTKAVALKTADLNGDNQKDFVLVLEDLTVQPEDEIKQGARRLLIIVRGADNKLTLAKQNDKVVLCRTCGGIWGDPFAGITVGLKSFTVNHYGGSNWRWQHDYKFNYSRINQTWQLVRAEESSYHTAEPNKVERHVYLPKQFGKIDIADFDPEKLPRKNG